MNNQINLRHLEAGELLFSEHDRADCAYIIEQGQLEISTSFEGDKVIICHLGPGEIVGEMAVIDGSNRTATAIATESTQLLVVTEDQLTERIDQADPILKLLVQILLDRYRSRLGTETDSEGNRNTARLLTKDVILEYVSHGIDKIRLDTELKEALQQEQLEVYYQPLWDVAADRIAGFEALTRWHHPKRGFISPELFISLAEETQLIVPVGLYVFTQACEDLRQLQSSLGDEYPLFMSINVSMKQIRDENFIEEASRLTASLGIDCSRIKLEITEGIEMDLGVTAPWIRRAKACGFMVSLDDFGAGFSSLATLLTLDFDVIKLDRIFIQNSLEYERDRRMLASILSMVNSMGLQTVVEGVEVVEHLDLIARYGCKYAQGYLIGKPFNLEQAHEALSSNSIV